MLIKNHHILLAAVPVLVALFAAYTVVQLQSRADAKNGIRRRRWRLTAYLMLGLGIWTTHVAGLMLSVPGAQAQLTHSPGWTALSLLLCLGSSVLIMLPNRRAIAAWPLLYVRSVALGVAVTIAHVLAIQIMGFDFHLSAHASITAMATGLVAAFVICQILISSPHEGARSRSQQLCMTLAVALAIAVLHYGDIAAAGITLATASTIGWEIADSSAWPDLLVNLSALAMLSGALFSAILDSRRSYRTSSLVDSLAAANRELNKLAYHDPLTRLPNRGLIEEKLRLAIEYAKRENQPLVLLFIDLDGLKEINRAFGHRQGDRLLAHVATQIQSVVHHRHSVARVGGDEFIVLLDLASTQDVIHLGDRILAAISEPIQIDEHALNITASLGIAQYPQDGTSPRSLLEHANLAMYYAKNNEQAYAFFETSMNSLARDHILLLSDLRQALQRQQLVLHFQPIMRAPDGPIEAAEVLIRWQHPQLGLLLPEAFIGHAERAGLIVDIGNWVIDAACQQLRQWHDQGAHDMRLSINVSAIQLRYELLTETLHTAVQRHGVEPSRLTLEFTESAAMKDPAVSLRILQRLHQIGFKISLDDFGTGYCNLLYLKQLPATELKIDRSFVSEIANCTQDRTIVAAIIALASQLQMTTVAEGIETREQKDILCALGCTYLQGFLLGAPVPASELAVVPAIVQAD